MAVTISWTKSWSASDDGTTLGGGDLGSIQSDIEGHSHTSGIDVFTSLSDVPNAYTAKGLYFVGVNTTADALEFVRIKRCVMWFIPDPAIGDSASAKIRIPFAGIATAAHLDANAAPSGGACTIQIQNNGVDMLTSALSLVSGDSSVDTTDFAASSVAAGDYLEVDVDAVNNANDITIVLDIDVGTT